MEFLNRAEFGWGRTTARTANPTSGLVIHYDGPGRNLTSRSHSSCIEYWKSVRSSHRNSNGWTDIGYSFGICPHDASPGTSSRSTGYVFEGRGLRREQAAQPGGNRTFYSVTLMLGNGEQPTDIQIETVRELREWLTKETGMKNVVKGHRDFISTSCPGDILYRLVENGTFEKAYRGDDDVSAKEVWDEPIDTTGDGDYWKARTVLGHLEKQQDAMQKQIEEILAILKK